MLLLEFFKNNCTFDGIVCPKQRIFLKLLTGYESSVIDDSPAGSVSLPVINISHLS